MIKEILQGYWGEKGVTGKKEGRLNNFNIFYGWAICSGIYPTLLNKWAERIGNPLEEL